MRLFYFLVSAFFIARCSSSSKIMQSDVALKEYRDKSIQGLISGDRAPLKQEDISNLDFYKNAENWRLTCTCTESTSRTPFEMPTYSGQTRTYFLHSTAQCRFNGKDIVLELYKKVQQPANPLYNDHLFLPFKDVTNGEETYGGGRYINLLEKDIMNNKIIIDFNKSYNPWCAYSDGYNCPVPPKNNHLEIAVQAGEKMYKGPKKQH